MTAEWLEPRKIQVIFLREHPHQQDSCFTFVVNPEQKKLFQGPFENFLKFCADVGHLAVDSVDDAETKKVCGIVVKIKGEKQKLMGILQNHIQQLAPQAASFTQI